MSLCRGLERRVARGAGQKVELGAVHCLPDRDTATIPTFHCIPGDTEEYQEEARLMGSRETWDACGGDAAHLRAVTHRLPQGGV